MTKAYRLTTLASFVLAAGCVVPGRSGPSPFDGASVQPVRQVVDVSIDVTNDYWLPIRVWVDWPDGRYFLGDVEPGRTNAFRLPGYLAERSETMRLFGDAVGSVDQILSDPLDVRTGRHIEWRLHRVLSFSRAHIM